MFPNRLECPLELCVTHKARARVLAGGEERRQAWVVRGAEILRKKRQEGFNLGRGSSAGFQVKERY